MRKLTLTTLLTVGALTVTPGMVSDAFAHGGSYRGPAGEVPPDSREPSDPPPPSDPNPPQTPGGDGDGPGTGGDVGDGPGTGGGDGDGPSTGGDGAPPPSDPGSGPGGPATGGAGIGKKGGSKGPGYEDWTFWWNFNKDEIIQLKSAVKKLQAGDRSGGIAHRFGRKAQGTDEVVTATDAAIQDKIVPALRELLDQDDLNFDIQSASAIALAKIGDESIIEVLKRMANNEKKGSGNYHKVVRESAGLAFGLLQKDDEDVRTFLIEVMKNKDNDSSFVRPFAAISLGLLGAKNAEADPDGAVTAALIDVVSKKEKKGEVKPAALVALGLLGNDTAVPALLRMLELGKADKGADELSENEMAFVVQALGKIGAPGLDEAGKELAVVKTIEKLLEAKKSNKTARNVKRSAAIALGQLAPQCDAGTQLDILKTLKGVVTEKKNDSSIRNFAAISIGRIGATKGIEQNTRTEGIATLRLLMNKAKPRSICQPFAALGLGLIGRAIREEGGPAMEDEIRKPLREKFEETSAPRPKGAYAIASGLVRDPLAVEALVKGLKDKGDSKLRGYCAVALGLIGAPDGREAIKAALTTETDRDLRVQTAVAAGLIGDAGVIGALVEILESGEESQYILGSVALSLGQIGDERSIEPLVRISLDTDKKFPDLTRALATVALGQIGDRRDIPVLARVARDYNYRAHVPALAELLTIL